MNISATIDRKITARYVFENTKYEIALICFLYSWYDLYIKYNPKINDSKRYTFLVEELGQAIVKSIPLRMNIFQ